MREAKEVAELIEATIKKRGETVKGVLIECGVGERAISNMKSGSMLSADKLAKLAAHLGTDTDHLLGTKKEPPTPGGQPVNEEESLALQKFKGLSPERRALVLALLDTLESQEKK